MKSYFKYIVIWLMMVFMTSCSTASLKSTYTSATKLQKFTFQHDGYERIFWVYCPQRCLTLDAVPLVIALHGGGGSAEKWAKYTNHGFEKLADRDAFILVYPNGLEKQWNDGRDYSRSFAHKNKIDDLGYLTRLIKHLEEKYSIDPKRIFMTGASNGGIMSHYMAAMNSEKIAAIAPVIASISEKMLPTFNPSHPVSVMMINGTEDPLVRWEGGMIQLGKKKNGRVISVEHTVAFWVKHNQCQPIPEITALFDRDPKDGTLLKKTVYSKGKAGTEVVLYTIDGGGHEWPTLQDKRGRLMKSVMDSVVGIRSRDIDACQEIWDFFKAHPKEKLFQD